MFLSTTEPDIDETEHVAHCFTVRSDNSLVRDVIFNFTLSPVSTASINIDFYLNTSSSALTIPAGSSGNISMCLDFAIFGDREFEVTEVIAYELSPSSQFDQVVFPPGSNNLLLVNVSNNLGMVYIRL